MDRSEHAECDARLDALESEANIAIESAGLTGRVEELVRLGRTVAQWRVATTSTLRRAILAEVRDEIDTRLEEMRGALRGLENGGRS